MEIISILKKRKSGLCMYPTYYCCFALVMSLNLIVPLPLLAQFGRLDLKIMNVNGKYGYYTKDMCNVFSKSFEIANPFTDDLLAIVKDSVDSRFYMMNLYGEKVSPYFQDVRRHEKTGLYIAKENESTGYAIYDIAFNKLTRHPYFNISDEGDYLFKCIDLRHVSYVSALGDYVSDFDVPFAWSKVNKLYSFEVMHWKDAYRNGLNSSNLEYAIYEFENNGFTAYVDFEGNVLVNYMNNKKAKKHLKKLKKKHIIPIYKKFSEHEKEVFKDFANITKVNNQKAYNLYPYNFKAPLHVSIAVQKMQKNRSGKVTRRAGKYFVAKDGNKQISIGEVYKNITPLENKYFLVENFNKKYALANICGQLITEFEYDSFNKWSAATGDVIYRFCINGLYGLMKLPNEIVRKCSFASIGNLTTDFAIAVLNEGTKQWYYTLDKSGKNLNKHAYVKIDKDKKGNITATFGYDNIKVKLDRKTGKELPPTAQEQYLDKVNNSDMSPTEQIEEYETIIQMGGPVTADAYNCMGYEYYNIGEKSKAREYFEKAKALGNTYAINNLKILDEMAAQEAEELRRQQEENRQRIEAERQRRAEERKNNVNEFVGLLGELAEVFGGGSSSSSSSSSAYDSDNSYSSGGSSYSSSSKVRANDKCHMCLGSGKCVTHNAHSKSACGGSGKCGFCNGRGVLHISTKANDLCPNCEKRGNGKCKRCHGTGKCPTCHGTGTK